MPINTNGQMWIYCVNVGQGDTTVIITPENNVVIIDAMRAKKITRLLMKAPPPNPKRASAASAAIRVDDATRARGRIYMYTAFSAM